MLMSGSSALQIRRVDGDGVAADAEADARSVALGLRVPTGGEVLVEREVRRVALSHRTDVDE